MSCIFKFVPVQTAKLKMLAINKCPASVFCIINPTLEDYMNAVKKDVDVFKRVPKEVQTVEMCNYVASKKGRCLIHVVKQTKHMCMLAVSNDHYALKYVDEQTKEICECAIKNNGLALKRVKEKTFELCMLAIQQNVRAIVYVPDNFFI